MRAPGEGDVAKAVAGQHSGSGGTEPGFTEDLEGKKQEHRRALEERGGDDEKEDWTGKKGDVNLGQALGGRGTGVVLTGEGLE